MLSDTVSWPRSSGRLDLNYFFLSIVVVVVVVGRGDAKDCKDILLSVIARTLN